MKKNLKAVIIMLAFGAFILSIGVSKVYAETYTNYDSTAGTVSCGKVTGIPSVLPKSLSIAYIAIEIAVPVVLVILGMIDLFKAVTAGKEDELNKARGTFFKRLISAALVFFAFTVVKLLVGAIAKDNTESITSCLDCFISYECDASGSKRCYLGGYNIDFSGDKATFVDESFVKNGYYIRNNEFTPTSKERCPSSSKYELKSAGIYNTNAYDVVLK